MDKNSLPPCSWWSPFIVSLYFSPRAADCKDTFTKGRPFLWRTDCHTCVAQGTVFSNVSFVTLTFKRLDFPPASNECHHFSPVGKWRNLMTLCRLFWVRSKWFLTNTVEMCPIFCLPPELNHSAEWPLFFLTEANQSHSESRFKPPQAKSNILTFSFIPSASNQLSCNSSTPWAEPHFHNLSICSSLHCSGYDVPWMQLSVPCLLHCSYKQI